MVQFDSDKHFMSFELRVKSWNERNAVDWQPTMMERCIVCVNGTRVRIPLTMYCNGRWELMVVSLIDKGIYVVSSTGVRVVACRLSAF